MPAVGLGTWLTFNVKPEPAAEAPLAPVLQTFFERGGAMVDSSPMYGLSEDVIGDLLNGVNPRDPTVYVIGTAVLLSVTIFATYLPARRASHVDPQAALRSE